MKTDKNSRTQSTSGTDTHPEKAFPSLEQVRAMLPKRERISYEKWLLKYRPIKNPFDSNVAYDGYLFETYGASFEFIRKYPLQNIWTLVEDEGKALICEGFHYVNRLGYFVTELAAPSNRIFCIKAD